MHKVLLTIVSIFFAYAPYAQQTDSVFLFSYLSLRIHQDGGLWLKAYFTQLKLLVIEKDMFAYSLFRIC
jgi:hypothetical protein